MRMYSFHKSELHVETYYRYLYGANRRLIWDRVRHRSGCESPERSASFFLRTNTQYTESQCKRSATLQQGRVVITIRYLAPDRSVPQAVFFVVSFHQQQITPLENTACGTASLSKWAVLDIQDLQDQFFGRMRPHIFSDKKARFNFC